MQENKKRLFVALDIPDNAKEKIRRTFLETLKSSGLSIVKKENLHITLCFIGYATPQEEKKAINALEEIKQEPFTLELKGLNHFNKRVVFIGVARGSAELENAANLLSGKLLGKKTSFSSHLTIARNKKTKSKEFMRVFLGLSEKKFSKKIEVKSLDLMESKLLPSGPVYSVVFEKRLSGNSR